MPIESETAGASAAREAAVWREIAQWEPSGWADVAAREAAVVGFHDPAADLDRRAGSWHHRLPGHDLWSLAAFGGGLARAEAEAWTDDEPHIATRAYEDRRFLLGDRLLHWAVPWLDATGRCYADMRDRAHRARDLLLSLGDRHRPAPADVGGEGLSPPGEDALGPTDVEAPLEQRLRSLWSGAVILDATVRSLTGGNDRLDLADAALRRDLQTWYEVAATRSSVRAERHPGSARLWLDLADRARSTARELSGSLGNP